jgi:hypothetical protein
MSTRQFCASAAVVALVLLAGTGTASAQGTVTWDQGYPIGNNAVPPNPLGSVDVLGSYTVNANWAPTSASLTYSLQPGGILKSQQLNFQNGKIGAFLNGQIVAARITMQKGSYQGWLAVSYMPVPAPPGTQPTIIISSVGYWTIN